MTTVYVKLPHSDEKETLSIHCTRISKKNNSLLYKLESYLDKKLLSDEQLIEIRNTILTVSAEIAKLPDSIIVGDQHEKL